MAHADVKHDYHLVDPSAWPIVGSIGAFLMLVGAVFWMNADYKGFFGLPLNGQPWIFIVGAGTVVITMIGWWRDVIAEGFTYANARTVAKAIARYVVRCEDARKGVLIGYDHRFASDTVAAAVAEVIASTGTPVWLTDKPCPTPAISLLVRQRDAAGGMLVTASHNPAQWNGIKYKASYGSSALPSIVAQIEIELAETQKNGAAPLPPRKDLIHPLEPRAPYLDAIEKLIDWPFWFR